MPAKRKMLPIPCPICGRENGTIQLVYFPDKYNSLVIRIGHYSSILRKKSISLSKSKNRNKTIITNQIQKRERVWCSFRSRLTYKPDNNMELQSRKFERSVCFSPSWEFLDNVYDLGWRVISNSSYRYKGRERRNIDYFEKKLK
jgi:hypothetical protein